MSYYCKNCGLQSMNEPFDFELCDTCWDKENGGEEIFHELKVINVTK